MSDIAIRKTGVIERSAGILEGIRDLPRHLNTATISAGLVAAIFGCSGPALIVMNSAMGANYTTEQTISWLFSVYFFGGVLSLILALKYKQPITGAWSIPIAVMLGTTLSFFTIQQAAGAYFIAGIIVLLLGFSGLIGKVMNWVPIPIVMGMIAGAMIKFGTGIISSLESLPLSCGAALGGYLLFTKISKKIPPILGALVMGIAAAALTGNLDLGGADYTFVLPRLFVPEFSLDAFLSISVPTAILVMGAENAQATGVLITEGYKPPINFMTVVSGIGGICTSFFGGPNANIAGPMTAICSSDAAGQDREGRYAATVVNGILFGGFGLIASVAVVFIKNIPRPLIGIVAGLAMIGVLTQAFEFAFSKGKFKVGAFFALVIAMSGLTIAKISAPFWALVGGVVISLIIEPQDFRQDQEK
ncbi:benzoate transporter [Desulfonema ishimotonii]|uniref:Benzoate transporter n=1 Tax=Desulfonema ishimotonii TaxID=45657 RepID=A0A401FQX5_9BACT|nr:benzoate/H(+) symporter BenE family transporter [Desulfonema ishimotonii]GBC59366.1 benzoate transporter [Desulfonema ishimotonii]